LELKGVLNTKPITQFHKWGKQNLTYWWWCFRIQDIGLLFLHCSPSVIFFLTVYLLSKPIAQGYCSFVSSISMHLLRAVCHAYLEHTKVTKLFTINVFYMPIYVPVLSLETAYASVWPFNSLRKKKSGKLNKRFSGSSMFSFSPALGAGSCP
jgi:hypothetical protein